MTDHTEDIGYLKAKAESAGNQLTQLFDYRETDSKTLMRIESMLEKHIESSEKRHDDIEEDIVSLKDDVGSLKKLKNLAMGFAVGFSFLFTLLWDGLKEFGSNLFS